MPIAVTTACRRVASIMGFSFRKSIGLGGGVRLNFSKRGLGISIGRKGLRVSKGPGGTQIRAGRKGLEYRKTISGRRRGKTRTAAHAQNGLIVSLLLLTWALVQLAVVVAILAGIVWVAIYLYKAISS